MKMLSIGKLVEPLGLYIWVEKDGQYQKLYVNTQNRVTVEAQMPMKKYDNYEHFVGVMGKFNPYTVFLLTPVEIGDELTYEGLFEELNWFEKLLRWEEDLSDEERIKGGPLPEEIRHKPWKGAGE
jgi:hypothetical protein